MDLAALKIRLANLAAQSTRGNVTSASVAALYQGTLSVMRALYGPDSSNERRLAEAVNTHRHDRPDLVSMTLVLGGAASNMLAEVEAGFIGSLQARIAGEVLADLMRLAKEALAEDNPDAKNVACVLAAAAFEDTLRRLAVLRSLPHQERLGDVVTALKDAGILQRAQIGLAQAYLAFRNRALHAKWAEVERPEAQSILAFTEGLLATHLS